MRNRRIVSAVWLTACMAGILAATPAQRANQMGTIAGRVFLPDGMPALGVRVGLLDVRDAPHAVISIGDTGLDGRYRLESIPPGRYYLFVGPLDAPTYFPGVISQTKASVVTVGVGTTLNDLVINLPLPLTFNVSGRVLRNDHERGMIRLTRDSQPFLEAGYASDGSFEFAKLPRGSYVLDVDRKARMTVNVDDHDIAGLEIAVPGTPDVTGVIIVEDGAPIPNLMLQFSGSLGVTGIAPLAEGAFAVRLRPGSYRLAVTGLPAGYEVKSIKEGAIDLLKEPLVVAPSVPTSDPAPPRVTVALGIDSRSRWVQITGRLKTTDIPAAARTKIGLAGKPFLEMVVSSVQEDGSFVFPLVLPGEYTLSLVPDSGFYRKVPVGADGLSDFVLEFNASDLHVR